jgi:pimeloyl-ACP methyl ester carboxylesterase
MTATEGGPVGSGAPDSTVVEPVDRWFDGRDVRVHGLDWGGPTDGPVVLMLHGVLGNAWIWDDVARRLRSALPRHRIVAIDQRDGGDTDHPATDYDREDFSADVEAVIVGLGGGPVVLVGHSRGGWLAAWIAASRPALVSRLVLVDPARLVFATPDDADAFYAAVQAAMGPFDSEAEALAWGRSEYPDAVWSASRVRSFLFGYRRDADGRLVNKLPAAAVPELRRAREGGAVVSEAVRRIAAPTLLLVAERQPPPRRADKLAYADVVPDVTVVRLDGTHYLHTDLPDEVAAAIARFVAP